MLYDLRKTKFTQEELAKRAGISRQALSNIEKGKAKPNVETLFKLSVALEVPIEEVLNCFKESRK